MSKEIFISYSSKDIDIVQPIVDMFKSKNISYWFAPEQLVGKEHYEETTPAIKKSKVFLIILSENSRPRIGIKASKWVTEEVKAAINNGKCILPIKLDTTVDMETENSLFNMLPNYLDLSQVSLSSALSLIESQITQLLLDDNYKRKEIDTLKIVKDRESLTLKDIEKNLKEGFWNISERIISENKSLEVRHLNYIILLNNIIQLSKVPIKDMNINSLNIIVKNLHSLRGTEFTNISYYLESMISKSYFKYNAIRDTLTDGYDNLKKLSKNESKIKGKYYLMCSSIKNIISQERYSLEWR